MLLEKALPPRPNWPLSARSRPPVTLTAVPSFLFSAKEEVVVAPRVLRRGECDSFIILLRREGDAFAPIEPVERRLLLALDEYEFWVDVYRGSDVPDDAVALNVALVSGVDGSLHITAYCWGLRLRREETRIEELLERLAARYSAKAARLALSHEHRPVLRLPPGSKYFLLPKVENVFAAVLLRPVGFQGRWTLDRPGASIRVKAFPRLALLRVFEVPPPGEGYMVALLSGRPTRGPPWLGARHPRRVHILECRMPPTSQPVNLHRVKAEVKDALQYIDWTGERLSASEVEEALLEALRG